MKRIASALLTLAAAMALVVVPTATAVHADHRCSNAALSGGYAITWSGYTNPNGTQPGSQVPWVGIGNGTFDGAGNVSFDYSGSINGQVFTGQSTSGTYTVNSDCTASLSFTSGDAAGFTANMVLIGEGKEVFGVSTGTGDSMTFDLKKQRDQD